ncbi:hypothetical protein TcWFU_004287 [Taenia crassiceps]|uniref:Uncharacterized protein n=1 Tax=Taenia crassiceps TaxID=6207 RepID=A0ABR4QBQ7_9CEST
MGALMTKPRSGDNPPKKIRTRTYSGSSLNKKPNLFKSLSKRKDETARKSATLQPTRTGDNLQVSSEAATEPILATPASCEVKSSPIVLDSQPLKGVDGMVAQESTALTDEAISKATSSILKEEEVAETPASLEKHPAGSEEQTVVEDADAVEKNVTEEVIEGSVEENKEVVEEEKEDSPEDIQEPELQVEECQSKAEADEPEPEPISEVVRDHQESEIAEILVNEALNAGVEAELEGEKRAVFSESIAGEQPGSNVEEQRPQSSDQSSDYVEALQQSQSVSEAFADPNEVTDGTKNIEVVCLNDETRDVDLKGVPEDESHEADAETEVIAQKEEEEDVIPTNNGVPNGHDEVLHGDNAGTDENGCSEGEPESDPIAVLKASIGEDVEHNESTTVQE